MVNIWALDKHQDIRHVLLLLTEQLGPDAFVVDTGSQQDARAVYLLHSSDSHLRIWLNTLGQPPEHYRVYVEQLDEDAFDNYESMSLAALVDLLSVELELAEVRPLP
ncbi:hypothetical protein SAMN05216229_11421 [Geopseudomonas sagittaria]|uniref:Uncharacterized protein n=1 Tax=Geopseudomonas sagittaria TaxID=1135990 RepID=A0A1I5WSC1_9GAMM|nr:hypothetical protein [Pseudomonas sagittaria]SFQ22407.1 hypothetical protein SAMN05216229_11421 [Pseudomonas sagittaria]